MLVGTEDDGPLQECLPVVVTAGEGAAFAFHVVELEPQTVEFAEVRVTVRLAGVSDRIRVRSVVGRFLEHTRVIYFRWGQADADEALYLSSADWMGRNMLRRIEIAWPVTDPVLRQRVIDECLVPYLHDQRDAWRLGSDGQYQRVAVQGLSAQAALMDRYMSRGEAR